MKFVCSWPITDPNMTQAELEAEAIADLPNVCPDGYSVRRRKWSIEDGHLHLHAFAWRKPNKDATHCPRNHPVNDANTYTRADGRSECRACSRERRKALAATADKPRHLNKHGKVRPVGNSLRSQTIDAAPLLSYLEAIGGIGAALSARGLSQQRQLGNNLNQRILDARRSGRITLLTADELSVRLLNVHPAMIFGDAWWDEDAMNGEEEAA